MNVWVELQIEAKWYHSTARPSTCSFQRITIRNPIACISQITWGTPRGDRPANTHTIQTHTQINIGHDDHIAFLAVSVRTRLDMTAASLGIQWKKFRRI
jgi:hypothetical protein